MMSMIRNITGFLLAAALVAFALFNRGDVNVIYSPVNEPLILPLYLIVLGMFAFGFMIGGIVVWLNMAPERRTRRQQNKKIKALEKELKAAHDHHDPAPAKPPSDFFPALPKRISSAINKA